MGLSDRGNADEVRNIAVCALCGGHDLGLAMIKDDYRLVRCNKCDLVFVVNPPNEAELRMLYSSESGYHAKYQSSQRSRKYSILCSRRNTYLFNEFASSGSILDVGCSFGGFLSLCAGYECVGLEINDATREIARDCLGLEIYEYTISEFRLRYPNRRFDYVTMWDVLEHMPDPNRALAAAYETLYPDGILFISVPDAIGLYGRGHVSPPYHLFEYNVNTLTQILRKHHFYIMRIVQLSANSWRKRPMILLVAGKGMI